MNVKSTDDHLMVSDMAEYIPHIENLLKPSTTTIGSNGNSPKQFVEYGAIEKLQKWKIEQKVDLNIF